MLKVGEDGIRQTDKRMAETWPTERALKLYDYFKDEVEKGTIIELEGHASCWATMALAGQIPEGQMQLYMPPFQKTLYMAPFKIGDTPAEGQMFTCEVEEDGDDIYVKVILAGDGNPDPFAVPFADTVVPALPAGKNLYFDLEGAHYLPMFCLPWTYKDCKTMYMCTPIDTHCVYSNDPAVKLGDEGKNPFLKK